MKRHNLKERKKKEKNFLLISFFYFYKTALKRKKVRYAYVTLLGKKARDRILKILLEGD